MQKKRLSTLLKKASRLFKVPILVARVRKSINIQRLVSLHKSKKLMLLKHYNYGYVHEYQFSPSNSPLLPYFYKRAAAKKRRYRDLYSVFPIGECLGMMRAERENRGYPLMELKALPEHSIARELHYESPEISGELDEGDDDSIDERAERFIERYYEEIRKQRLQQALVQLNPFILDMD